MWEPRPEMILVGDGWAVWLERAILQLLLLLVLPHHLDLGFSTHVPLNITLVGVRVRGQSLLAQVVLRLLAAALLLPLALRRFHLLIVHVWRLRNLVQNCVKR